MRQVRLSPIKPIDELIQLAGQVADQRRIGIQRGPTANCNQQLSSIVDYGDSYMSTIIDKMEGIGWSSLDQAPLQYPSQTQ